MPLEQLVHLVQQPLHPLPHRVALLIQRADLALRSLLLALRGVSPALGLVDLPLQLGSPRRQLLAQVRGLSLRPLARASRSCFTISTARSTFCSSA
jgi:hypothetical protein